MRCLSHFLGLPWVLSHRSLLSSCFRSCEVSGPMVLTEAPQSLGIAGRIQFGTWANSGTSGGRGDLKSSENM